MDQCHILRECVRACSGTGRHRIWIRRVEPNAGELKMALPLETNVDLKDPRTVRILAKSIYRELRDHGLCERDVMALAGELLSLVTSDVRSQDDSRD
jgi:hypothetical protein